MKTCANASHLRDAAEEQQHEQHRQQLSGSVSVAGPTGAPGPHSDFGYSGEGGRLSSRPAPAAAASSAAFGSATGVGGGVGGALAAALKKPFKPRKSSSSGCNGDGGS
jgi:hypothetical protein